MCMSFEHVFTVKAWHVQPHKESIGFDIIFFNGDFLVKIAKCFRCFWSILIEGAASDTPCPEYTHSHTLTLSLSVFSWINLSLEAVGNWTGVPGRWRLTPFVMFKDLISLWQDMMSLDKRNEELWLFDFSFPHWTFYIMTIWLYMLYENTCHS